MNQRLPSGPAAMPALLELSVEAGSANSARAPDGLILPILLTAELVNQMLPSGPAAIPNGELNAARGMGNSAIDWPEASAASRAAAISSVERIQGAGITMIVIFFSRRARARLGRRTRHPRYCEGRAY